MSTVRRSDFPFLADWYAISARWVSILAAVLIAALRPALNLPIGAALALLVALNLGATALAMQNRRVPAHRILFILADSTLALALFAFSGGLNGPLPWVALIPLLSASIYYEWRGALLTALAYLAGQAAYELLTHPAQPIATLALPAALTLLAALLLGFINARVVRSLRRSYMYHVSQREQLDRRARSEERNRMQAVYRLIETLSATLNYTVVLDTALDLCSNALGETTPPASEMVSAVLLFGEECNLEVSASRRFSPTDVRQKFPAAQGILHEVLKSGEARVIQEIAADPELGKVLSLTVCKSLLCLPLLRGLNAFGVMIFGQMTPDYFTPDRTSLLEMLSHQAVIAIQNARLFQDVAEEKERIIETQEEARKKLARDLHDGPTQSLAAITMRVDIVRKMLQTNPAMAAEELDRIYEMAVRTTKEIRHMLFTLRPLSLESEGLEAALHLMADKMHETYQQNVQVDVDSGLVDELEIGKQTVIFYLVEEALNNARKHAHATQMWVRLKRVPQDPEIGLLEVADNGVGFDVQAVNSAYERRGSLGMVNLRERTDLIGGLLMLDSAPGKGTRVRVYIPLSSAAVERIERGRLALSQKNA